jgi:hypothetical protein
MKCSLTVRLDSRLPGPGSASCTALTIVVLSDLCLSLAVIHLIHAYPPFFLPSPVPTSTTTLPIPLSPPPALLSLLPSLLGLKVAIVSTSHLTSEAKEFFLYPEAAKIHELLAERTHLHYISSHSGFFIVPLI